MAQTVTFLAAVNAVLKRVGVIQGSSGELSSFTDAARQQDVDICLEIWNEIIDELFRVGVLPQETAEGTLTLATSQTSYSFSSDMSITDFVKMASNPFDSTNENILTEYPGGWRALFMVDRSDRNGQPRHFAINTSNGNMEIDATPTSDENGDTYTFLYEKSQNLTSTTDTFPFEDDVTRTLYPAVGQAWKRERNGEFDEGLFMFAMARAAHMINPTEQKRRWGPRAPR